MAESNNPPERQRKGGVIRGSGKLFLDVRTWFSLQYLKSSNKEIISLVKGGASQAQGSGKKRSFEQAMADQGVSEADLKTRCEHFQRNALIIGGFGVVVLLYAIYLLFFGSFVSFLLGVMVAGLCLVKAYQFSLWRFQIIHRKLGCTFHEWSSGKVSDATTPS